MARAGGDQLYSKETIAWQDSPIVRQVSETQWKPVPPTISKQIGHGQDTSTAGPAGLKGLKGLAAVVPDYR